MRYLLLILFSFVLQLSLDALQVGVGRQDITPPLGTPSAGYEKRKGAPMQGVLDPLYATAMVVDTGTHKLVFCSVDNLGLPFSTCEEIKKRAHLENCSYFIGSSHTHSGGGAYFDVPVVGELLAGKFDPAIKERYIQGISQAIIDAANSMQPAKIGLGYSKVEGITEYRSKWPEKCELENDLAIIKVTKADGSPLAILCNFALHPTVLKADNMLFSSDFVGPLRQKLQSELGNVMCLYFNGAQGEIIPPSLECQEIGNTLAERAAALWRETDVSDSFDVQHHRHTYSFIPETTPYGFTVPLETYPTELSLLVVNKSHLFVAMPGELSCLYNTLLKKECLKLGYSHLSVLGLTNDAHGYILMPEAWHAKTMESGLSFGGELYGKQLIDLTIEKAKLLRKDM